MDTPYSWTLDVERDWGGRADTYLGIKEGIPQILEVFRTYDIKALFFVSTEVLNECRIDINRIKQEGHEIGSHGHFHVRYKERWRWEEDRRLSEMLLAPFKQESQKTIRYRAPWFNQPKDGEPYSVRESHVSILKYTWFGGPIPQLPIFYLHPFDLVKGVNAPSLYTRILYARPDMVYNTFVRLVSLYPGTARLG